MDKKVGRKKAKKTKEGKRVFRLKAAKPASNSAGATAAGAANDDSSTMDTPASEEAGLPLPQPTPSSSDRLLSMEQQLRAGIPPTLPASAHERAELLASSLLPNGNGSAGHATAASAGPLSNLSPHVSSFVVPIAPSLTKKRARPTGRDSAVLAGGAGGSRRSRARRRGEGAAVAMTAAGGGSTLPFFVVKEWEFAKNKRGEEATVKKPCFFYELWMMMAAFGDPRGAVTCKCSGRGQETCACVGGVAAMEAIVRALGARLLEVCREWSDGDRVQVKHIQMAMPGEMREYTSWKEAHSKRGTKNEVERGADLRLEGLEDDTDSDSDPDGDDDDNNGGEVDGKAAAPAATPNPENGAGNGAKNGQTPAGAAAGVGGLAGGAPAAALEGGARAGGGGKGGNGDKSPWQTKMKPQQQHQHQQGESVAGETREWAAEEEEVASRMEHRRRSADEQTASMGEEDYVNTFFEFRKAFFMSARGGGHKSRVARARGETVPGSRNFLARYLKLDSDGKEAGDRKLLEVLAYVMYDHVGRVVEAAIRKRTGGRLVCGASDPMLSAEEITAAWATLPPLPSREQRENVRACRAANPDGIAHNRPLVRFPVGLEHRGRPLRWPRNTIQGGRVLVEGGEVVDASDQGLAEEAMALLESDFADF